MSISLRTVGQIADAGGQNLLLDFHKKTFSSYTYVILGQLYPIFKEMFCSDRDLFGALTGVNEVLYSLLHFHQIEYPTYG